MKYEYIEFVILFGSLAGKQPVDITI